MSSAVAARPDSTGTQPPGRVRPRGVLSWLWITVAASPFLVAAAVYAATGQLVLGSDQALLALDTTDARHGDQLVGPYSRMGWAHPGPAWFLLLAPTFALLGSSGPALVAASLTTHAAFAALLVATAGRERAWQQPLMAGVVLLYALRMPADLFAAVWNPYALLLPTLLLVVLAARAALGHVPALAGAVAVGSFLVQTHVGTVPLVGAVGAVAVLGAAVQARRRVLTVGGRRGRWAIAIAVAATIVMWAPTLWQQATADGQGNLAMLTSYFVHGDPAATDQRTYGWAAAVSAVGQLLGVPVYGWSAAAGELDPSNLGAGVLLAVAAQLAGALMLAVAGWRLRAPLPAALGLTAAAGTAAGLVAARVVTGELQNYLLIWVTVLPAALAYGYVVLAVRLLAPLLRPGRVAIAAAVAGALAAAVLVSASLLAATERLTDQPGVDQAAQLALDALPAPQPGAPPVFLDIASAEAWPTATGVALQLEQAGHRVSVNESWVKLFGRDRAVSGAEEWTVVVVAASWAPQVPGTVLGTVPMETGEDAAIIVSRIDG